MSIKSEKIQNFVDEETVKRKNLVIEVLKKFVDIKIHCLEQPIARKIMNIRSQEIAFVSKATQYSSIIYLFEFFLKAAIIISIVLSFNVNDGNIDAASIFISIAYYQLIFYSMLKTWPNAIMKNREASALFNKIRKKLIQYSPDWNSNDNLISKEPMKNQRTIQHRHQIDEQHGNEPKIFIKNFISLGTNEDDDVVGSAYELSCKFLNLSKGKRYCLFGESDIERGHFIKTLLGEINFDEGQIEIDGRISFSSEKPCVISGSIKQNILFVEKYDEDKYRKIIEICDLKKDEEALNCYEIDELLMNDLTLKHKLNLARCFYVDAEIYIIEDIFDEVDKEKWKNILKNAINLMLTKVFKLIPRCNICF